LSLELAPLFHSKVLHYFVRIERILKKEKEKNNLFFHAEKEKRRKREERA